MPELRSYHVDWTKSRWKILRNDQLGSYSNPMGCTNERGVFTLRGAEGQ
jgi:hypothetical protein